MLYKVKLHQLQFMFYIVNVTWFVVGREIIKIEVAVVIVTTRRTGIERMIERMIERTIERMIERTRNRRRAEVPRKTKIR